MSNPQTTKKDWSVQELVKIIQDTLDYFSDDDPEAEDGRNKLEAIQALKLLEEKAK